METHAYNLYRKTACRNKAELVRKDLAKSLGNRIVVLPMLILPLMLCVFMPAAMIELGRGEKVAPPRPSLPRAPSIRGWRRARGLRPSAPDPRRRPCFLYMIVL